MVGVALVLIAVDGVIGAVPSPVGGEGASRGMSRR